MNEFYFEYQVFDGNGVDVSKQIKFYLDVDYSGDLPQAVMYARIVDWNEYGVVSRLTGGDGNKNKSINDGSMLKYVAAEIKHRPNASDGIDDANTENLMETDEKGCLKRYRRNSEYEDNEGRILVSKNSELFSGTGLLLLYTNENGTDAEKYFYSINCFHKIKIHYVGYEKGKQLVFKFRQKLNALLSFYVVSAENGLVPCLNDEVRSETPIKVAKGDNSVTVANPFPTKGTVRRYRLVFSDNVQSRLYLLIDDTPSQKSGRLNDAYHRPQRCPYCLRLMKPPAKLKKGDKVHNIVTCQGNVLSNDISTSGLKEKHRICCSDKDVADGEYNRKYRLWKKLNSSNDDIFSVGEKNELGNRFETMLLPKGYENGYNMIGSVLGAAGVGKSIFLSRLMNIKYPINAEDVAIANAAIMRQAVKPYRQMLGYQYPLAYNNDKKTFDSEKWTEFFNKKDADFEVEGKNQSGLLLDYAQKVYSQIPKRTDEALRDLLQKHPFIMSVGKYSNMILFDLPGEALRLNKYVKGSLPTVDGADFLVLLINMDSKSAAASNLQRTSEEFAQCINVIADRKRDEGTLRDDGQLQPGDIDNVALAVVLCKFDELDENFDINSAVRSSVVDFKAGKYFNSDIYKNTNSASDEVKRFLSTTTNSANYADLEQQINYFKYNKFFAISALGASDSLRGRASGAANDESDLLYLPSPKRLEHVLLWLMWQGGIIS